MSERVLWIGLVHLKPLKPRGWSAFDGFDDSAGAYSKIITWAGDAQGFRTKAEQLAAESKLYVVDIEGEEPLSNRVFSNLDEELQENATHAQSNPNAIIDGRFLTYPHDDA